MRIDAHQHFWRYNPQEYEWMGRGMEKLHGDFLPEDLEPLLRAAGVQGTVAIQARQSVAETAWLLDLARQHDFIRGVVGWVPLADPRVKSHLEKFAADPKLKGIRHVLHNEPDTFYMLRDDFGAGINLLHDFGLAYDILIYEDQLPQTIEFVDRHPGQTFILDHLAKPHIHRQELAPWRDDFEEIATRENVYCKISGMITEGDWQNWSTDDLRPYFDEALEAFTPNRLMFGSAWPFLLLAGEYKQWLDLVLGEISELSADERAAIMSGNAIGAYRL
jgi:L-fuconolactonase